MYSSCLSVCLVFLITAQKVMDTLEFFLKNWKNRKLSAKISKKKKHNLIAEEYDGENFSYNKEKLHC